MAKNTLSIRQSATDYLQFQLISSGLAINLSTVDHVEMNLKDNLGNITTFTSSGGSPKLFITDTVNGIIELRPAATDFYAIKSPYLSYILIYETASRWYAVPEDTEMKIIVRRTY